jgi:hypothetical protein
LIVGAYLGAPAGALLGDKFGDAASQALSDAMNDLVDQARGTGERGQTATPDNPGKHERWDARRRRWYTVDNQTGKKRYKGPGYRPPPDSCPSK